MERKIGKKFTINGKTYIVEEDGKDLCRGCAFDDTNNCDIYNELLGHCLYIDRKDKKNVHFKEVIE